MGLHHFVIFQASFWRLYRPPDSPQSFVTNLHDNLAKVKGKFPKAGICLLGDFNYPDIDWHSLCSQIRDGMNVLQLTLDYSLVQLVHQPTGGNSMLDLVFASDPDSFGAISYSEGISDYALLNFKICISSCTSCIPSGTCQPVAMRTTTRRLTRMREVSRTAPPNQPT